MLRRTGPLVLALLLLVSRPALAAEPKFDWSAWEHLPVYHNGRIMPLNTLANTAVEIICKRANPTLRLAGAVPESELNASHMAAARSLFPNDEPRKFRAPELLLSWLVEAEKWEHVPFLIAEHDELRSEILDVPVTNEKGEHLKYVSPAQVRESAGFWQKIGELADRKRAADAAGEQLTFTGVDAKCDELYQAFQLYFQFSQVHEQAMLDPGARSQLRSRLEMVGSTWARLENDLRLFQQAGEQGGLEEPINQAEKSLKSLADLYSQRNIALKEIEPLAETFAISTAEIARRAQGIHEKLLSDPPKDWSDEQLQKFSGILGDLATQTRTLARRAEELQLGLYENSQWLRVVPALNPAALDANRDPEVPTQPWLDLQTLVYGSPRALRGYPQAEVQAVRQAFARLKQTYPQRATRPNEFSEGLGQFAVAVRNLGEAIDPLRWELPIKNLDEDALRYTAYPPPGATATEVRYSKLDPFLYSWIISFIATIPFVLYFIGIRWKSLYWGGLLVLVGGLIWSAYGFYMRVVITGWAPVTNMYETVIYVPFFVSLLGAWFALLPMTWDGLKNAWRLTATPRTWEATPLSDEQRSLYKADTWTFAGAVSILPRAILALGLFYVLTIAPYAAGGRTIINLLPNVDAGSRLPDFNSVLTWAVGLCVLLPTLWYLPRVILTAVIGAVTIPQTLRLLDRPKIFAQVYERWPFGLAATSVATFGSFVAWYSPILEKSFSPLQPVLRDNFWLFIHVLTIVSSYGAGALAWGLGNLALGYYLFGRYRQTASSEPSARAVAHRPARAGAMAFAMAGGGGGGDDPIEYPTGGGGGGAAARRPGKRPPEECAALASYVYKATQVAVVLLAAGTILGALWADVAWGRFWGWDPKEVWALISFLVYLAILHGRYAGLFGNFGLVVGSVLGASAIVMSWYGVNFVLGVGLHSYGFGAGGQGYVMAAVALNWLFLGLAATRYLVETRG